MNNPSLSILIPTIVGREDQLKNLISIFGRESGIEVFPHCDMVIKFKKKPIEICVRKDDKQITVGEKRNKLLEMSNGLYVAYADDDDRVSDDYIEQLLEGIKSGADIITFDVSVSIDGATPKPCYYSMYFDGDKNEPDAYYRLPNHLMCVKREIALQVPFKEINFGEDADYAKRLKPLLKSEHSIHKVLYHYDYNSKTTATQRR